MSSAKIGFCEFELYLPGMLSLKEKRGIIKSLLNRMRQEFNVANAEVDHLDDWQNATIAVTCVSTSSKIIHQVFQRVEQWMERRYPDAVIIDRRSEIL